MKNTRGGCPNTSSPSLARVKFKYICLAACSGCLFISAFFLLLHFIDHGLFLSAVLPIRTLAYKRRTVTASDKHIVMYVHTYECMYSCTYHMYCCPSIFRPVRLYYPASNHTKTSVLMVNTHVPVTGTQAEHNHALQLTHQSSRSLYNICSD